MGKRVDVLKGISCECVYDPQTQRKSYHFSWERIYDTSITHVCIARFDRPSGNCLEKPSYFQAAENPDGIYRPIPLEQLVSAGLECHCFAVFSVRGNINGISRREFLELPADRIYCKTYVGSGLVKWMFHKEEFEGYDRFELVLDSNVKLSEDVLQYSYCYQDCLFKIPIPAVDRGQTRFRDFWLPKGASDPIVDAQGSGIEVRQKEKQKIGLLYKLFCKGKQNIAL